VNLFETTHDKRWLDATVIVAALFLIVQFPAQWLLSKNYYNVYVTFDSYMHIWGNFALGMIPFLFVFFACHKLRYWTIWYPIHQALAWGWEAFEIASTKNIWIPLDVLSTTVENSLLDGTIAVIVPCVVFVGYLLYTRRLAVES
jgi:hypothetical protein